MEVCVLLIFIVSLWVALGCAYAQTVTASPLFPINEKDTELKATKPLKQEGPMQPPVNQNKTIQNTVAAEKAPPLTVKKKTLLRSKYINSKRSAKRLKRAAIRRT